ncbi:hypothetical protein Tco_1107447 [Tanacetum coccineum]
MVSRLFPKTLLLPNELLMLLMAIAIYGTKNLAWLLSDRCLGRYVGRDMDAMNAQQQKEVDKEVTKHSRTNKTNNIRFVRSLHMQGPDKRNGYAMEVASQQQSCGKQRHYRSECSKLKNQNYDNQKGNEEKAHEDPNVIADNANA